MDSKESAVISPAKFEKLKALAHLASSPQHKSKIPIPKNNKQKLPHLNKKVVKKRSINTERPSKIPQFSPDAKKKRQQSSQQQVKPPNVANKDYTSELNAIRERSIILRSKIDILREKRIMEVRSAQQNMEQIMDNQTGDYYQAMAKIFYNSKPN
ncbi:hypothetical protein TVAG_100930 [Trichomonas vaginalis G3]|uniref:Uncharacterized protein n=1 Tax=Trichomonas vaginalis (strain ATCC PRA-98 / G3) TaxID=412133 RepID=A2DJH7_TRIV3|nr:hypothetical protein TVAGG3_1036400 [Trichomonas vaginalis G3]EAY19377.1 hypothetical protein TVAG_100930 [Trichomonas vaginalis G3]KAI5493229.1 hypothetical protein TVAGG3_1036400 [Trichomonas vaginalis G3]|eukprot:XP_001580363.1 hypothetical protein [Trichomonas vaginalis G3]